MRLWTVLICTVIALQSMVVLSETWSCSYINSDQPYVAVFERVEGGFINPTDDITPPLLDEVVFENDEVIHLHHLMQDGYVATILSKTNKAMAVVMLTSDGSIIPGVTEGRCKVY